ncbi:hypothetical protein DYB28_006102 [Aphanomyces astaci]|uniref:CCHC-type domain-containing protein n=1 Tax=Aphanomyces astaci TaxID=112090 RepID=A0A9X8H9A9_APHAT|nr:hypothetical protein DYB28_006102 [Aphanomyces astaci]
MTLSCSISNDNGQSGDFIKKRKYSSKKVCFECTEAGHYSYDCPRNMTYDCPRNMLGGHEKPKKSSKRRTKFEHGESATHRSDEHAQSIEWDGARNPLQPRQHFEEREEDGGDDFDEHLERLVALPASFHSGVIIRMLGSICKQRGLPLPPMPVQADATVDEEFQPERTAEVEEPPKPTKRKKTDKVSKLLKHLGHV